MVAGTWILMGNPFWLSVDGFSNKVETTEQQSLMEMSRILPHLGYLGSEVRRAVKIEEAGCSSTFWIQLEHVANIFH
mgnify:CR=1 FL=1